LKYPYLALSGVFREKVPLIKVKLAGSGFHAKLNIHLVCIKEELKKQDNASSRVEL
jgi:hypothetical protein